jgi:hypothetical protein
MKFIGTEEACELNGRGEMILSINGQRERLQCLYLNHDDIITFLKDYK